MSFGWCVFLIYVIGLIAAAVYFYHDSKKVTAEDSDMPFILVVFACVLWFLVAFAIVMGWIWQGFCKVWDAATHDKE